MHVSSPASFLCSFAAYKGRRIATCDAQSLLKFSTKFFVTHAQPYKASEHHEELPVFSPILSIQDSYHTCFKKVGQLAAASNSLNGAALLITFACLTRTRDKS